MVLLLSASFTARASG